MTNLQSGLVSGIVIGIVVGALIGRVCYLIWLGRRVQPRQSHVLRADFDNDGPRHDDKYTEVRDSLPSGYNGGGGGSGYIGGGVQSSGGLGSIGGHGEGGGGGRRGSRPYWFN